MSGALSALSLTTVLGVVALLRDRLGPARALGVALATVFLAVSGVGLALLDLRALQPSPLRIALVAAYALVLAGAWALRRRLPARAKAPAEPGRGRWLLAVALVLAVGTGLRQGPSPYLHGGQDQGIYVNVGHHIARTGQLRPVDRLMRGAVRGVRQQDVHAAYRLRPVPPGSPLDGVREGYWIAGIHIEDAGEGRLIPAFFQLMPVWFALAELDWGFPRSTWPLVLFWALSGLAACALGHRLTLLSGATVRRARQVGLVALTALALHPLDLWISTFPVTENLARACLLAAAWLALEGAVAEREGRPGATLLAGLGGLGFAAGAFTRGSFVAHAIVLAAALVLAPTAAPRARRALLWALTWGTTLAVVQAILHSWPYFFSAATNHFQVPRLQPHQGEAVLWALAAGAAVLAVDHVGRRLHAHAPVADRARRLLRTLTALLLAAAAAILVHDLVAPAGMRSQQVLAVLTRHGGPLPLLLGLVALAVAARRADDRLLPWVFLAAEIALATALRSQIRYEFYYARYIVADLIPALLVAAAWLWGRLGDRLAVRSPRAATAVLAAVLLAWLAPPLRLLSREVYWTRDLEDSPQQLGAMFGHVPEDALLFFDDRAPLRWRGILATPAMLSFGRQVLAVRPDNTMVENALKAGTPVYFLSGGWEPDDRQRWPSAEHGPWRTEVVARGTYRALRAEIVEGGAPERLTDWGGPWELQRIDRSIWRSSGAFSLYPESVYVHAADRGLQTEALAMPRAAATRLELWLRPGARTCSITAALRTEAADVPLAPLPRERDDVLLWAMPAPTDDAGPSRLAIAADCPGDAQLAWRWLSVRPAPQ